MSTPSTVTASAVAAPATPAAPAPPAPTGTLPAVASLALRALIAGPSRPVRELARFSQALYLVAEERSATGSATVRPEPVIALLGPGAVAVPGGIQLALEPDRWPAAPVLGTVGDGRLSIDGRDVVVHRWWDPVPQLAPTTSGALRERAGRVARLLESAPHGSVRPALSSSLGQVLDGLVRSDDAAAVCAADAMIGLGPGLTPSGDDMLAGLLASIPALHASVAAGCDDGDRAAADPGPVDPGPVDPGPVDPGIVSAARRLAATVARRAHGRTTTVSAELLRHAANGAVARPVLQLLHALSGRGAIEPAAATLLRVGSSSGRDLTVGILAAVTLFADARTLNTPGHVSHPTIRTLSRGT